MTCPPSDPDCRRCAAEKRGSDNSADGTFAHANVAKFGGFKHLLTCAPSCRAGPTLGRAHNPALLPVPIPVETGALGATNEDMTVLDFKRPTVGLMLFTAAAPPPTPSSCSTTPARPSAPPSPPRPAAPPSANSGARGALHGRRTEPPTPSAAHSRPPPRSATRSTTTAPPTTTPRPARPSSSASPSTAPFSPDCNFPDGNGAILFFVHRHPHEFDTTFPPSCRLSSRPPGRTRSPGLVSRQRPAQPGDDTPPNTQPQCDREQSRSPLPTSHA